MQLWGKVIDKGPDEHNEQDFYFSNYGETWNPLLIFNPGDLKLKTVTSTHNALIFQKIENTHQCKYLTLTMRLGLVLKSMIFESLSAGWPLLLWSFWDESDFCGAFRSKVMTSVTLSWPFWLRIQYIFTNDVQKFNCKSNSPFPSFPAF